MSFPFDQKQTVEQPVPNVQIKLLKDKSLFSICAPTGWLFKASIVSKTSLVTALYFLWEERNTGRTINVANPDVYTQLGLTKSQLYNDIKFLKMAGILNWTRRMYQPYRVELLYKQFED